MRQRLSNPKLKWWQGVLLIIGIIVVLMLGELFGATMVYVFKGEYTYTICSVGFWIFGGAVAIAVVRSFILEYEYTLTGSTLRIERVYNTGKPRFACDVLLRNVRAYGTLAEVEKKYPSAPRDTYLRGRNPLPELSLAYSVEGKMRIVRIQPNDEMREKLISVIDSELSK